MAQNQGDANIRESEEVKELSTLEQEESQAGDKLRQDAEMTGDAGMAMAAADSAGQVTDKTSESEESASIESFMQTAASFKQLARSISDKLDSLPDDLRQEVLKNNTGVIVNNKPLFKDEFIQVIASADLNMSTQSPEAIRAFLQKADIA